MLVRLVPILAIASLLLSASACNTAPAAPGLTPSRAVPPVSASTSDQDECDNEYFPVIQSASWSYVVTGGISGQFTRTIMTVSPVGFTTRDVFSNGMIIAGKWQCDDGTLMAMQPDEGATAPIELSDQIEVSQTSAVDGINLTEQLVPGATWEEVLLIEGSKVVNGQGVPASDALKLSCAANNVESISVPAGTFKAVRSNCRTDEKITLTIGGAAVSSERITISTLWYGSGVGLVKSEQVAASGAKTTVELISYLVP